MKKLDVERVFFSFRSAGPPPKAGTIMGVVALGGMALLDGLWRANTCHEGSTRGRMSRVSDGPVSDEGPCRMFVG